MAARSLIKLALLALSFSLGCAATAPAADYAGEISATGAHTACPR
jgi:hypothetical protein